MKIRKYKVIHNSGLVEVYSGTFKSICKRFKGRQVFIVRLTRQGERELNQ